MPCPPTPCMRARVGLHLRLALPLAELLDALVQLLQPCASRRDELATRLPGNAPKLESARLTASAPALECPAWPPALSARHGPRAAPPRDNFAGGQKLPPSDDERGIFGSEKQICSAKLRPNVSSGEQASLSSFGIPRSLRFAQSEAPEITDFWGRGVLGVRWRHPSRRAMPEGPIVVQTHL